jgi:hypothetical protein
MSWGPAALIGMCFVPKLAWADGYFSSTWSSLKKCLADPPACFSSSSSTDSSSSGPILAHVGGAVITASDLKERIDQIPAQYRPKYQAPQARRQLLDSMIDQKLIVLAARKKGLDREPSIQRQLRVYEESLLRQEARSRFGIVSDQAIIDYYNTHKGDFGPRLQVEVSQIQIKTLDEAKQARAQLQAGKGVTINRLVFPLGAGIKPAFMQEVLSPLKIGQIAPLVKVSQGYLIVRKDQEMRLPAIPVEAAKIQIKGQLEYTKLNEWTKQQRSSIPVSIDEKALEALK